MWELLALKCLRGRFQEELRETWEQGVSDGCSWKGVIGAGTRMTREGQRAASALPVWEWLHELAEAGDTGAMRRIAQALLPDTFEDDDYRPPEEDIAYARQWLTRAAEAGDSEARKQLAWAPTPRFELEQAAANGDRGAMTELAMLLEDEGALAAAEVWWRGAVDLGSDWAPARLAALLEQQGRPVIEDDTLLKAAENHSAEAMLALAKAYEAHGNCEQAERLLRSYDAVDHGYRLPLVELLARQRDARRLQEAEQRLRTLIQEGSPYAGEEERAEALLVKLLRTSGRGEEAERFTRLGLEPNGRTALGDAHALGSSAEPTPPGLTGETGA